MTRTTVYCCFRFAALHRWPEAKGEVAYLAHPHRHEFHARVDMEVRHEDRDIEFIGLKNRLRTQVEQLAAQADRVATWSCETWASQIMALVGARRVEVSEDGENGAVVEIA
jgi:hypothetical protein